MLYRIGTLAELKALRHSFPPAVIGQLYVCTSILDEAYGENRNYMESGGYTIVIDKEADLAALRATLDLEHHPPEWVDGLGEDWLGALFLLNDDYSIVTIMPVDLAPLAIKNELEEQK